MPLFKPETPSGGAGFLAPGPRSGHYLYNAVRGYSDSIRGENQTEGDLLCTPYYNYGAPFTADRITIRLSSDSAGSSGALIRLGIYSVASDGGIGDLLVDAGTTSAEGASQWRSLTISQEIPTGVVLVVAVVSGTGVKTDRFSAQRFPASQFWFGSGIGNEWAPIDKASMKYTGYDATVDLPSPGNRSGEAGVGDMHLFISLRAA